jgi:hypothetical protein
MQFGQLKRREFVALLGGVAGLSSSSTLVAVAGRPENVRC